jgi:hypothetical protein
VFSRQDALEIRRKASTDTALLGRGVNTDEDEVGLLNPLVHIGGEEEIAASRLTHDLVEARLVDGKVEVRAVPSIYSRLIKIYDRDLDVGALECNDSARRSTCKQA